MANRSNHDARLLSVYLCFSCIYYTIKRLIYLFLLGFYFLRRLNIEDKGFKESWLTALHNRGIHIAIDDFGTGYSSLSYLQNLRVDRLKIDRGFINGIITNKESLLITESIIQLAHNVGAKVIAEGGVNPIQKCPLFCHSEMSAFVCRFKGWSRSLNCD